MLRTNGQLTTVIDDLVTLLKAQSFAGVGSQIADTVAPQEWSLPFVVCENFDGDPNNTLDGAGGVEFAGVTISVKAATRASAKSIGAAIKAFIRNYTGAMGTVTCKAVLLQDDFSGYEKPTTNGPGRYTRTIEIEVHYQ